LLVIAAVALIVMGIQGIHEAHAFSKPVDITCEQFMKSAPPEGWYRIKGGEIDVSDSVYIVTTYRSKWSSDRNKDGQTDTDKTGDAEQQAAKDPGSATNTTADKSPAKTPKKSGPGDKYFSDDAQEKSATEKDTKEKADKSDVNGTTGDQTDTKDTSSDQTTDDHKPITEVYIPVHVPSMWNDKTQSYPPTDLVVQTSDAGVIATVNQLKNLDKMKPAEMKKWLVANMDKMVLHRDIVGMVQAGINADSKTHDLLAKDQEALTSGYLIVEEGKKPSMSGGLGALFGGILLGVFSILYWGSYLFRWKQRLT